MKNDLTNKQLLDAVAQMFAETNERLDERLAAFATKEYLDERLKTFATKEDLKASEQRLARKIDSHQRANIQHHLESRRAIGELGREIYRFREA